MSHKKKHLEYKKERVILSDTLPYEVPITFSNRYFYDFLISHQVEFMDGTITWKSDDNALDAIMQLIFDPKREFNIEVTTKSIFDKFVQIKSFQKKKGNKDLCFISIPFNYKISHKENEYRQLTVPHPKNQVQMIEFYNRYKELILYYCDISPFSIRKPKKISRFVFHKDKTHYNNLTEEYSTIEQDDREYENLRSFFVYKDYSNIHKFYESYKHHRCEKKYNKLLKLDISKCFDSIYTHSVSWALINKQSVKENIKNSINTFAGKFDKLMQQINYNETNGIIIGPEFSRIFAELILQAVDKSVMLNLQKKHGLLHKTHYEIFRYVDDYFIFYNDEGNKANILEILQLSLKDYNLYLNTNKQITYEKPIITEISIAKHRVAKLLDEELHYEFTDPQDQVGTPGKQGAKDEKQELSISINSTKLITQFKTIVKESAIEYKDIINYTLAITEEKSKKIIKAYNLSLKGHRSDKKIIQAILGILDFAFLIYSVSPRVNSTIKLCRILKVFISFLKDKSFNKDLKHLVFKFIYDDICFILRKNKSNEHTQVETLYLLVVLSELGREYRLEEDTLLRAPLKIRVFKFAA